MTCTPERPEYWNRAMENIEPLYRDALECYVSDLENRHRNLQDYVTHVLLPAKSVTVLVQ